MPISEFTVPLKSKLTVTRVLRGETRSFLRKRSLCFESENVRFWSPVDSPLETCFLEVFLYQTSGKKSLCLEANNN